MSKPSDSALPENAASGGRWLKPMTVAQALEVAARHHVAGRLLRAERLYRGVLEREPNHPEALQRLGVIAHQGGRDEEAVALIGKAVARTPQDVAGHFNLGLAL